MKSELSFHLKIRRSSNTNQHYLAGDGSSYSHLHLDMTFTHLHLLLGVDSAKKDNPWIEKRKKRAYEIIVGH